MLANYTHGIDPRLFDVFGGIDTSAKSLAVTFADHGRVLKSFQTPNDPQKVIRYAQDHFPNQRVVFAYEAGPTGYGLHDDLGCFGYPCLVVSPQCIPTASGDRVKTNRLDSKKIALSLRGGELKSIHVPNYPYRQLRHLAQLRDVAVRQATSAQYRIKSLLLFESIPFPHPNGKWTLDSIKALKELQSSPAVRFKLDCLLDALRFSKEQTLKTQKEIHRLCQSEPPLAKNIDLLTSIPGIGRITAGHLLARIGDPTLIRNSKQVPAFLGLVPKENSTGEDTRRGSITKSGDSRLRNKLVQSAWVAIKQDPDLAAFFKVIHDRNPHNHASGKAITAVARKLAMRVGAVLKNQTPYKQISLTPSSHFALGDNSTVNRTNRNDSLVS